ncbi:hypothetical protein, partial [Staphylococcus intermedius]|uniref:Uncharacterized protein n=2 Tax=Staphylococcus intermedius TaxID=1285 RepID=A0A380G7Z5_STAIN
MGDLTAQHLRKYAKGIIVGHNGRLIVYSVNKDIDFGSFRYSLDILGVNFKSKYNISKDEQNNMLSKLRKIGLINYEVI